MGNAAAVSVKRERSKSTQISREKKGEKNAPPTPRYPSMMKVLKCTYRHKEKGIKGGNIASI